MSHIATIETSITDLPAIRAACGRLGIAPPEHGTQRIAGINATGLIVKLKGWGYPIVINPETGALAHETDDARYRPKALAEFRQAYAIELARRQAKAKGHSVTEQRQANGTVRLILTPRA